jgi:8-oxo-dGTP diphosphatase
MKIRNVALIIFYDENKRILLQDRKGISKYGEEWGFFGGGIEEGETPEEAVLRETREELDFDLKEYKYVGNNNFKVKDLSVRCKIFISPLKNISEFKQKEGKKMELFSLEEAKKLKMVSKGDIKTIKMLNKFL